MGGAGDGDGSGGVLGLLNGAVLSLIIRTLNEITPLFYSIFFFIQHAHKY